MQGRSLITLGLRYILDEVPSILNICLVQLKCPEWKNALVWKVKTSLQQYHMTKQGAILLVHQPH